MVVRCEGQELGYTELALQKVPLYVGLIACEGRNRFYDFEVTQPRPKKKK